MAFSAVVRRFTSATARYSVEPRLFPQSHHSLCLAPYRPLLAFDIHYRGGSMLPSSFIPLTRFSSSLLNKQSTDAEVLRIIKSEIKSTEAERRVEDLKSLEDILQPNLRSS